MTCHTPGHRSHDLNPISTIHLYIVPTDTQPMPNFHYPAEHIAVRTECFGVAAENTLKVSDPFGRAFDRMAAA